MPVQPYPRQPDSLTALKKIVLPTGDAVSPDVLANDPELALPQARSMSDFAGNDRLKQMLGLGPSPLLQRQQKELSARDEAINNARIAANPEVSSEADKAYKEKLALAGEPSRVAGQSNLAVQESRGRSEQALQEGQQSYTRNLIDSMGSGGSSEVGGANGMRMSINAKGEPTFAPPPPMGQMEQQLVDSAHQIAAVGVPLLSSYEAKYPGIGTDPKKYGSPLSDTLTEKLGKGIYSFGGMTDNDELLQKSAAIQAWGVRALAGGRITKPLMDMISAHLPQPGFSPGANYTRLKLLLTDILPAQLQGVSEGRGATPFEIPKVEPSDPYSDPNYRPK